jgi:MFS family permease
MRGRIPDRNIWLIYATIFLLGLAYGISISLVAIYLDERGYSKEDIGLLGSVFAVGLMALALPMGALIRRLSARALLVATLFGYAATVTAFPFLPGYRSIIAVRFLDGAFSVGVWVSCETILLSRAGRKDKAFVTSLYAIAIALGYAVGPVIAYGIVARWGKPAAFVTSGVLAAAATALVLARLDPDVAGGHEEGAAPPAAAVASGEAGAEGGAPAKGAAAGTAPYGPPTPGATVFWRIKTSCLATFSYAYFQASVVLFLPIYLMQEKHVAQRSTILVPAAFAAGMLLFSIVAARLGDRFGHLAMMRLLAVVGTLMIAGFVFLDSFALMLVAVFIAGSTLATISPVSLALQGVITAPRDLSRSTALYNLFGAAGMLLGPLFSSRIFQARGGVPMLWHLAAMWGVFVVLTVVFFRDDPAVEGRRAALRAV